jgi:simple sugar transport system permease protein
VKARAFAYAAGVAELVGVPLCAAMAAAIIFGVVVAILGVDPLQVYGLMWLGGFGTWFSWQNTLVRAAPLLLTALCFALPAQMGFAIIGGEGAFIMGGLAATLASLAVPAASMPVMLGVMALAGCAAGAVVVGISGVLRVFRGVNETISSLLMTYLSIAVFNQLVEGPFRDHSDLDQASTLPIPDQGVIGDIGNTNVHWGIVVGVVACLLATLVIYRTGLGFAMRVLGGNGRAARMVGISAARLTVGVFCAAGAIAGLGGMIDASAVDGRANNSLIAGYGYQGIFVSFIARQNPLLIMPVALLLGGIGASGGLVQRRTVLPYASVLVLQGVIFLCVLVAETLRGRGPLGRWRQTMVLLPDPLADTLADTEEASP